MFKRARSILILAAVVLICSRSSADVVVTLTDGSQLHADFLDVAGENEFLLRIERPGIVLTRRLQRKNVAAIDGKDARVGKKSLILNVVYPPLYDEEPAKAAPQTEPPSQIQHLSADMPGCIPMPFAGCGPIPGSPRLTGIPTYSVVVGVRNDPLDAYADSVRSFYPHGVPLNETPFALDVLRGRQVQRVFSAVPDVPATEEDNTLPAPQAPATSPPPDPFQPVSGIVPSGPALPTPSTALPAPIRFAPSGTGRIQSIVIEAVPVSARGKADWDSLAIRVVGIDRFGQPVPVQGTMQATLWGQTQQFFRAYDDVVFSEPRKVGRLANWTAPVFGSDLTIVPLATPLPEHNPQLAPVGELHVTLLVPGQGAFEATQSNVLLKRVSAIRDRQWLESGSPFFSNEGTSDRVRRSSLMFPQRSTLGPNSAIFTVKP